MRAREVVVLPACCLVAATNMGRMRLVENGRHAGEAALLAIVMELIDIMVLYWLCL